MTRRFRLALIAAALLTLPIARSSAQTATFAGAVVRDTLSHGIAGAIVSIPTLNRADTTNAQGEFKMTGLPAGRYAALIRHIGFRPMVDTVLLINGDLVDREYVMDAAAVMLDSVRVKAASDVPHLSARMSQFEEHRKSGVGGHFITESDLRKNDSRKLNDVITSLVPGLRSFRPAPKDRPTMEYLSSGRGGCGLAVFQCGGMSECPVTLYTDGVLTFNPAIQRDAASFPDLTRIPTNEYAAVEYYAGGASVPPQYNATGGGCGILVLWSREK